MAEFQNSLVLGIATMRTGNGLPGDTPLAISNAAILTPDDVCIVRNTPDSNLGVVKSYQHIYENTAADIIMLMHDDCIVRERGWDARVMAEFDDPLVAIVGFGGALAHGTPDLFKVPYRLQNLIRGGYRSAVDDAEVHGERFTGACDVVFVDGFFMAIRRSFLDRIGGWSFLIQNKIDFIGYDMTICALARRHSYKLRMVGIRAQHRGGGTSVRVNIDRQEEYEYSHRWFYNEFKDVMPCRVNPQSF